MPMNQTTIINKDLGIEKCWLKSEIFMTWWEHLRTVLWNALLYYGLPAPFSWIKRIFIKPILSLGMTLQVGIQSSSSEHVLPLTQAISSSGLQHTLSLSVLWHLHISKCQPLWTQAYSNMWLNLQYQPTDIPRTDYGDCVYHKSKGWL